MSKSISIVTVGTIVTKINGKRTSVAPETALELDEPLATELLAAGAVRLPDPELPKDETKPAKPGKADS